MIEFYLDNDTAVMKMLEDEPQNAINAFLHVAAEQSEAMAEQIKQNVSGGVLQTRTGTLEASVQPQAPKIDGLQASAEVVGGGGDAYYGEIQELGISHPYPEQAAGDVMAFEDGGSSIFTRLVEHPAMPAHPWFLPVLDEMAPQIIAGVHERIQETLDK